MERASRKVKEKMEKEKAVHHGAPKEKERARISLKGSLMVVAKDRINLAIKSWIQTSVPTASSLAIVRRLQEDAV